MNKKNCKVKKQKKNHSKLLNNWEIERIIHCDKILEFEWLKENDFITKIIDKYYYLNTSYFNVEKLLYEKKIEELMNKYNIKDIDAELKILINKFNKYNEIKDIAQSIIGRIAEIRGKSIKEIHYELDVFFND